MIIQKSHYGKLLGRLDELSAYRELGFWALIHSALNFKWKYRLYFGH